AERDSQQHARPTRIAVRVLSFHCSPLPVSAYNPSGDLRQARAVVADLRAEKRRAPGPVPAAGVACPPARGGTPMPPFVLRFDEVDRAQIALVGGKGAHLGELTRIEGVRVPSGFCVTTEAYQRLVGQSEAIRERLERLALLGADDAAGLRALSAEIRRSIEATPIPDDVAAEITDALDRLGQGVACAVRSSATAEDLPT